MSNLNLIDNKEKAAKESFRFNWQDSLPVQRLLDAISSILAEKYFAIAKQNPTVFSEVASPRQGGARNDNMQEPKAGDKK